jgi:mRNA-degrading endonuclease RelE of RelBE toxin-antitoxin system
VSAYRLLYHPLVLSRDIPRLDPPMRKRIRVAIERKLTKHPEASAKPLAHTVQHLWSLRVGDWRVIFALREKEAWILKIGHRRDVYSERAHREPPDDLSVSEPDQYSSQD